MKGIKIVKLPKIKSKDKNKYLSTLKKLTKAMNKSLTRELTEIYKTKDIKLIKIYIDNLEKNYTNIFSKEARKLLTDFLSNVQDSLKSEVFFFGYDHKYDKQIQASIDNNLMLIKNIPEKAFYDLRQDLFQSIANDENTKSFYQRIVENNTFTEKRAKRIARDQTAKLYSEITQVSQRSNGIEYFQWGTAKDSRVSKGKGGHKQLEGKIYKWGDSRNYPIIDSQGNKGIPAQRPNCYHKDIEVYTEDGFKLIKDVVVGERILTLNPLTKDLKWSECVEKHRKFSDKVINYKSNVMSLSVDLNHRFFCYKNIDHGKYKSVEPLFVDGSKNLSNNAKFYCSSEWKAKSPEFIRIGKQEIPVEDFCLLMGYYLSEGNTDNREDINGIKIAQEKHLDKMFDDLAFFNPRKGKNNIYIFNMELKNYLKQFGYSYQKFIPKEIKELNSKDIRVFLDAFALGDGTLKRKKKGSYGYSYNTYYTSSKKLADGICELVIKCNMGVSCRKLKTKGKEIQFKNGLYTTNHDIYLIQELKNTYKTVKSCRKDIETYNDYTYDIGVKDNHTLLIKYGKDIHWNSNCRCVAYAVLIEDGYKMVKQSDGSYIARKI